jgi:hypothetical protein
VDGRWGQPSARARRGSVPIELSAPANFV